MNCGYLYEDVKHIQLIYTENENSSKMQLQYMETFIERVFKLSLLRNKTIIDFFKVLYVYVFLLLINNKIYYHASSI